MDKTTIDKSYFREISPEKVTVGKDATFILTLWQRVFFKVNSVVSLIVYKSLLHNEMILASFQRETNDR